MSKEASPTPSDLNSIEAEWPVIEAELAVVEAECRLAVAADAVAVRAHRRAVTDLADVVRRMEAAECAASRVNVVALGARRSSRSPFLAVVPTTPGAA